MSTVLIQAQTENELAFIQQLLQKNNIQSAIISDEDMEDINLLKLMQEVDMQDTVPKSSCWQ